LKFVFPVLDVDKKHKPDRNGPAILILNQTGANAEMPNVQLKMPNEWFEIDDCDGYRHFRLKCDLIEGSQNLGIHPFVIFNWSFDIHRQFYHQKII